MTDQPGREERILIKAKLAQQLQERVKKYRENSATEVVNDCETLSRRI